MKKRENCVVKKGFFPSTAKGLEETFCLVSLDTDLYETIMDGLEFFYPRLQKGGYIFVQYCLFFLIVRLVFSSLSCCIEGTEKGKKEDLIIMESSPLEDLQTIQRHIGVVKAGKKF